MNVNKKELILSCLLCLLPIILFLIIYNDLPTTIPIHWNSQGQIDNEMNKNIVGFIFPVGFSLFNAFLNGVFTIFGKSKLLESDANTSPLARITRLWLFPALAVIILPCSFFIALGYNIPIISIVTILVGLIFVIIGNYLPKTERNWLIGFRFPWTIDDKKVWKQTNRFGGYLLLLSGICSIVLGILSFQYPIFSSFVLLIIIVPIIATMIYSFVVAKRTM